jgi:hypothetical protein
MNIHQNHLASFQSGSSERHLNLIIKSIYFGFARTYSANAPFSLRYKDHARHVEMVLTAPNGRVERLVEQYFEKRAEVVSSQLHSPSAFPQNENR